MFEILAYITGGLIVLFAFLSYLFKKRTVTLLLKFAVDFLTSVNGVFIYFVVHDPIIFASVVTCGIGSIRSIVYLFKGKNKFIDSFWCPLLFATLAGCSLIFTYKTPLSILPAVGSVISALTVYLTNQKYVKIGAFVCYVCYVIYYIALLPQLNDLTIFSMFSALAALVSSITGFFIIVIKEHKDKKSTV